VYQVKCEANAFTLAQTRLRAMRQVRRVDDRMPSIRRCPGPEVPAMSDARKTLYERLGGYDAISAVANDLLSRLEADPQLGRFWAHRGQDGVRREKQLLIDFLCASAGGPIYYRGRDMVLTHRGMRINDSDWNVFLLGNRKNNRSCA
jgi:hemoglobin